MSLSNLKCRILLIIFFIPFSLSLSPITKASNSLQVMTFNIMQLGFQDWDQNNRLQHTPNAIRQLNSLPDVIVFNEAFTNDSYSFITSHLADLYPYSTGVVGQDCSGSGWDSFKGNCSSSAVTIRGGVFIISRHPIKEKHAYVYHKSHSKTWDYWANKGAAFVKIYKNGAAFNIIGTHLQADEDDAPDAHDYRMAQLREMNTWIKNDINIPSDESVIIAGDLNVEFSKKQHVNDMVIACHCLLNYTANPNYGSFSSSTNWVAKANAYSNSFSLSYNDTLDYVMAHQGYRQPNYANMAVIKLKSTSNWYWGYLYGNWGNGIHSNGYYNDLSDHYPVVATFNF